MTILNLYFTAVNLDNTPAEAVADVSDITINSVIQSGAPLYSLVIAGGGQEYNIQKIDFDIIKDQMLATNT